MVIASLLAGLPPTARADVETLTAGPVTAQLSYDRRPDPPDPLSGTWDHFTSLRVTIARNGRVAYAASLYDRNCVDQGDSGGSCHPANRLADSDRKQSISLRDLDADGEPEVIVDLRLGGAHDRCYTIFYRYTPPTYTPLKWLFNEPCYAIAQLDASPAPELITRDTMFSRRFAASTAGTAWPLRIWDYSHGALVNVTRRFPDRIGADRKLMWTDYKRSASDPERGLGVLAAWTADEYLLGHRRTALRILRRLDHKGRLHTHFDLGIPTGSHYIRALDHFLLTHGYGVGTSAP
jgi:hypothetical protein